MMMSPAATIVPATGRRPGITLLEVLIACGLLVMGLSTMASLLPASGARLAQASVADRAGILASNALADSLNRGLIFADMFPTGTGTATSARTLALGAVVGGLPEFGVLPSERDAAEYFTPPSGEGRSRCGSPRTFLLEDELAYEPPSVAPTPGNAFATGGDGSPGPRRVRDGVCWGATLTPEVFPAAAGGAAVLAIAVFKRSGEAAGGAGKAPIAVGITRANGCYEADVLGGGSLLKPCSWVLAIPGAPGTAPRWFQVMSSWTFEPPAAQTTCLIFRNQPDFASLSGSESDGKKASIIAFGDLVRVDEHRVTLN